jgi:hypothetical protein
MAKYRSEVDAVHWKAAEAPPARAAEEIAARAVFLPVESN